MRVLVVCAHPDDEVYCGGTIAALAGRGDEVHVLVLTEGCSSQYKDAAKMIRQKKRESAEVAEILGIADVRFVDLPDMKLDTIAHVDVNAPVEEAVRRIKPALVLTHHTGDLNLDHRIAAHSTLVATRPAGAPSVRTVAACEGAPGGRGFRPNWYVDISGGPIEKKLRALSAYKSEMRPFPHFRSPEAIEAHARLRGAEAGLQAAESFEILRKTGL